MQAWSLLMPAASASYWKALQLEKHDASQSNVVLRLCHWLVVIAAPNRVTGS
jgi:hypothetical protein